MNNSYKLIGVLPLLLLAIIFTGLVSASSGVINTFLTYDNASAISKTVTQGDSVNLYLVAYGHGEQLYSEKLELVSSTLIFQENVAGDQIATYTWLYTKSPYILNTAILNPGTYTLRFTAVTKTTKSSEYSDLQLIILPKTPVCGNGAKETGEQCDLGSLNGQVCSPLYGSSCTYCSVQCTSVTLNGPYCGDSIKQTCEQCDNGPSNGQVCSPLYGSSCTYCSNQCKSVTLNGPYCGDHTCNGAETCSTCASDCGACPVQPKCGDNVINQANETCDNGVLNGNVCSPLYGSSCTYCSNQCKSVTLNGPYCGDHTCNGAETCSTCASDCGACPVQVCHIELTKSVSKSTAKPNDTITYTLHYKNTGNAVCTGGGVEIQDTLSNDLSYMGSFTKNVLNDLDNDGIDAAWYEIPGFNSTTNTLTWNAHRVSPGEEGTITFNVKVLTPSQCGDFQISNFFKAWSNEEQWKNSNTVNLNVDYNCPVQPKCGDGVINQANETCDKGILNGNVCTPLYGSSCTYCSNQCKNVTLNGPYCGDHTCNGAETCSTCASDCGACAPQPKCGDGVINQANETCDKGILNGNVCSPLYGSSCTYCSNQCKNVTLTGGFCGDGIKQTNEECDDHNNVNGDGCSSTCKTECPPQPVCGDNVCNNGETCSTCSADCGTCPIPEPKCSVNHFVQFCDVAWKCSGWSECNNGMMTRNCIDTNNCDTEYNKPVERSDCTTPVLSNAYVEQESVNVFWIILVIVLFVLLLLVIIYLIK
jgi:uncharacterized repeat protein (TIGR01451 family)